MIDWALIDWGMIEWRDTSWLWLACWPLLLPLLKVIKARVSRQHYAEKSLLPWVIARQGNRHSLIQSLKYLLFFTGWILLTLSLARPAIPEKIHHYGKADWLEVMVLLDVSRSMTARDVLPNRLERAKLEMHDLLDRMDKMKIGIALYAGQAHLLVAPTSDKQLLRHYVNLIEYGMLPIEGSDLNAALRFTAKQLQQKIRSRSILLITDGDITNTTAQTISNTVSELASQLVHLHILGVGTETGAAIFDYDGGWLYYQNKAVTSQLQSTLLQQLAYAGNGLYSELSDTDRDWYTLYDQGLHRNKPNKYQSGLMASAQNSNPDNVDIEWQELYHWFLIPAILLILLGKLELRRFQTSVNSLVMLTLCVTASLFMPTEQAMARNMSHSAISHSDSSGMEKQAYAYYQAKNYVAAEEHYAQVHGFKGRLGEGSAAYRQKNYHQAIQQFTQAFLDADTDPQRAHALFNLANSHYQLDKYHLAIKLYQDVAHYLPQHQASQINLGYAKTMLANQLTNKNNSNANPRRRSGRGPATGEGGSGGRFVLDDKPQQPTQTFNKDNKSNQSAPTLIESGIHQSEIVETELTTTPDQQWQYESTTPEQISARLEQQQTDESQLWQRIFSDESGLHGPVERPLLREDLPPW